jgi:hypothetical protein
LPVLQDFDQSTKRDLAIDELRPGVTRGYPDTGGPMPQHRCRLKFIYILAAGTTGARKYLLKLLWSQTKPKDPLQQYGVTYYHGQIYAIAKGSRDGKTVKR